jgi:hypothetical protein
MRVGSPLATMGAEGMILWSLDAKKSRKWRRISRDVMCWCFLKNGRKGMEKEWESR